MLEPQAEDPKLLLEHHRRRAALNVEAGDEKAAYWHGRQAQKALAAIREATRQEIIAGERLHQEKPQGLEPETSKVKE